jgi:hypothetical protein
MNSTEIYGIHIRELIVKIQEYTNKFSILKYMIPNIKTLELRHVSTLFCESRECTSKFVYSVDYKQIEYVKSVINLLLSDDTLL